MRTVPPPLSIPEPAWIAYVRFFAVIAPAILALLFTSVFLFPKVMVIWKEARLDFSRAQWFVETANSLLFLIYPISGFLILLCIILEFRWSKWSQIRSWMLIVVAALFTTFVLTATTMTSIAALLATPVLIVNAKKTNK